MKKTYLLCTIVFFLINNYSISQNTPLLIFQGFSDGMNPSGSLISDGTFLYGMTPFGGTGGTSAMGTIFKIMPNGTGYVKLMDFDGSTNGSYPNGSLITDGSFLYGMTRQGGTNDLGTIFKIMPDGTGYVKLLDFNGTLNGGQPEGSLIFDGTFLYGMTSEGGISNQGTIFKILPDGTGYLKLLDFAGVINGASPLGSLFYDGTFLFGMTSQGGTNDLGSIFKIMSDGTGYIKLLDFTGLTNGKIPRGELITDGTFLYGMTSQGGASNNGTIFKIMPDGSGYVKLLDFVSNPNGMYPNGSLITDGTFLYGMTYMGGSNDYGTIFKIMPDGTGFVKLQDFVGGANGRNPLGSLYFDSGFLYGMTKHGGTINNLGVIFNFGLTSGIEEKDTSSEFTIYPNPSTDIINVNSSGNGAHLVSITNILGDEVFKLVYHLDSEMPLTINLSDQKAGIYFLRIGNCTQRIIRL